MANYAVQRRRGTTAQHGSFTGLEGELSVDTTKDVIVVHDGSTAGGRAMLREDVDNLADDAISGNKVHGGTISGNVVLGDGATATTQSAGNSSTKLATTAYVDAQVDTEDTLAELDDTNISGLASGHLLVYDGSNSFDNVAMSGDITIVANGATTIANGAVDLAHMSADSVDSTQYVDASIDLAHMSADSVDSTQYVDGSIDLAHMSANSVDSDQYIDGSIDLAHMSANSIDSDQYVDGSIDAAHLAAAQTNITSLGTLTALTVTGVITGGTVEATTDTAAGDNAAIGYTSSEGLILTGQGSTNDVTIKNDADATVISIPTGTTNVGIAGALTVTGNFTVNGTTTTISTTNTVVEDTLLELNTGAGSNANDMGLIMERGSTGDNAIFMWDESADKFTLGTTTAAANATGNISITVGTLVAALEGNATTATTVTTVEINDLSDALTNSNGGTIGLGTEALTCDDGTQNHNTAVGFSALTTNDVGTENSALGYTALQECLGGNRNTAIGSKALYSNIGGNNNTASGYMALNLSTTGDDNTASGHGSLKLVTTGDLNIGLGSGSGDAITTGSNNTIIGDYPGSTTLADTVVVAAGTAERIKVNSTGLSINSSSSTLDVVAYFARLAAGNSDASDAYIGVQAERGGTDAYFVWEESSDRWRATTSSDGSSHTDANMQCGTLYGVATSALYSDLAERYASDAVYEAGTVVSFGGENEVTQSTKMYDTRVAGVVSTNPAHLMNAEAGTNETHPAIALSGRVPVKVMGTVRKGDLMVTSAQTGVAMAADERVTGTIIGKAIEAHTGEGIGVIEVLIAMM